MLTSDELASTTTGTLVRHRIQDMMQRCSDAGAVELADDEAVNCRF